MELDTVAQSARVTPVPENNSFIRRREDSKRWFRTETGELERNIRWNEVGDDAYSPTEFPAVKLKKIQCLPWAKRNDLPRSGMRLGKDPEKGKFILKDNDIVDLCYRERSFFIPGFRNVTTKQYLCRQPKRRSWEKFGGPEGLKKARELRDEKWVRRTAATLTRASNRAKPTVCRPRGRPSTTKKAPSTLLHLFDESDVDSGSTSQDSSSPPLTPGAKSSPIHTEIPNHSGEDSDIFELPESIEIQVFGVIGLDAL